MRRYDDREPSSRTFKKSTYITMSARKDQITSTAQAQNTSKRKPIKLVKRFLVYKNLDNYDLGAQVGEGTYGQVFKAWNKSTKRSVALKKLYLKEDEKGKEKNRDGFPITGIREIEILRSLTHPNIVELEAMVSWSDNIDTMHVYMVFEYMDHDLTGVLNNQAVVYNLSHIKCLGKQIFQGLEYLHSKDIIHRDIKGANLLLNNKGFLKIADFGLARRIHLDKNSGEPLVGYEYTNRVVTLWYRSPELLLGSTSYGFEVDIWSAGSLILIRCILMEFYTKYAIFQGRTEIDQIELIFKLCGSPTELNWPGINDLPWNGLLKFPHCERVIVKEFNDSSYGLSSEFVDLVDKLLTLDPSKRPNAAQALAHAYFISDEPLPCEPNQLPAIQGDWHEYETKMRRKQKFDGNKSDSNTNADLSKLDQQILHRVESEDFAQTHPASTIAIPESQIITMTKSREMTENGEKIHDGEISSTPNTKNVLQTQKVDDKPLISMSQKQDSSKKNNRRYNSRSVSTERNSRKNYRENSTVRNDRRKRSRSRGKSRSPRAYESPRNYKHYADSPKRYRESSEYEVDRRSSGRHSREPSSRDYNYRDQSPKERTYTSEKDKSRYSYRDRSGSRDRHTDRADSRAVKRQSFVNQIPPNEVIQLPFSVTDLWAFHAHLVPIKGSNNK